MKPLLSFSLKKREKKPAVGFPEESLWDSVVACSGISVQGARLRRLALRHLAEEFDHLSVF